MCGPDMVNHFPSRSATQHPWHERIEHYTPDKASGRLLLAIPTGSIGVYSLVWSVASLIISGFWPLLLVAGVSLGAIVFSLMMLWPVYLSLIGNIESAKAYSQAETTPSFEGSRDDAIAVVKRQYAAGNISEAEFERRVGHLLTTDAEFDVPSGQIRRQDTTDAIGETD
jgi:uncharacterized membrane protein